MEVVYSNGQWHPPWDRFLTGDPAHAVRGLRETLAKYGRNIEQMTTREIVEFMTVSLPRFREADDQWAQQMIDLTCQYFPGYDRASVYLEALCDVLTRQAGNKKWGELAAALRRAMNSSSSGPTGMPAPDA